jgi:hypothetical protein
MSIILILSLMLLMELKVKNLIHSISKVHLKEKIKIVIKEIKLLKIL